MKFRVLVTFLLAITFSQHIIASECSSDKEQQKYVTEFVKSFRAHINKKTSSEADIRNQLGEKADKYAKSGVISQEQARNLFVSTLKDPVFHEFEKEKGIINSKMMIEIALFDVEKSNPKEACVIAKKVFGLFDDIHNVNLEQYKLLDQRLEYKKYNKALKQD